MSKRALDTRIPFTREQALAHGARPGSISSSRFRLVFRDVYVDRGVELTPLLRARGALAFHPPGAYISHVTAAQVMDLPVPATDRVHVTALRQNERRQRPGIACHVAHGAARTVEHVSGLTLSAPLDLFVELAGVLPLVDLVVAGDAMARRGLFTAHELREFCHGTQRWHSRRARRGALLVRDRVDSPAETRLRLLLVMAGLPEPEVNWLVRLTGGAERFIDLAYWECLLAIEYDGRHHVAREQQWSQDLLRREQLETLGWKFVVITADGLYKNPAETIRRVAAALAERGRRPRSVKDQWKVHFPVR